MAPNKMLIDATHPEETRVVVLRNGRVEEFDYESAARKLLRGNIYLAKVTRVEPSLQAAFVDYGGNRHGFLAFSEIHPDYYQIPMADRQALLDEEALAEAEEEAAADARAERLARRRRGKGRPSQARADDEPAHDDAADAGADEAADLDGDEDGDDNDFDVIENAGADAELSDSDEGDDENDDDAPKVIAEASVRDDVLVEDVAEIASASEETRADDAANDDAEADAGTEDADGEGPDAATVATFEGDAADADVEAGRETGDGASDDADAVQEVASPAAEVFRASLGLMPAMLGCLAPCTARNCTRGSITLPSISFGSPPAIFRRTPSGSFISPRTIRP